MTDTPDGAAGDPGDPPLTRRDASHARRATEPVDAAASLQAHMRAAREEFEEANERIKERTGRDLIVAILIGVAIGLVLVGSLIFIKWIFVLFALGAGVLGTIELSRALVTGGRRVDVVPQVVLCVVVVLSGYFLEEWVHWVLSFAAVVVVIVWRLVAQMIARDGRRYGDVLADALVSGFVQLYVPFLTALCVVLLRQDRGEWWVLAYIIVAVASDTGAYATGLLFGKHPMAPRISPKKTWEGFGGAVVFALVAGVLLAMFMLGLPWWTGLIFGAAILLTATMGDLGESMIKRDIGIKDMSSWLPGHGGVLDRLDSILPSTVAALALYYLLTPLAGS